MSDFTTTANLNLKKPAIGGSSDKWGEYLNENMETIGTSIVNLQNASTSRSLESLNNVLDTTATTGQLLQYDTGNWKAATVTIPDNIQDLSNVTITSPANGQVLAYSTSNSRWENQTPGAATIPDGTITNAKLSTSLQGQVSLILQTTGIPTDNQIVRYDSTTSNWQFEDLPGGTVSALSDTDVSGIGNKDALVYNSTSGNWVSRPLAIADVTNLQTTLNAKLESADISVSSLSDTTITTTADDSLLVYDSSDSKWKNEGPSTVRSTLSLVVGTNVQAFDQGLQSISALTTAANQMIYTTASETYAVTTLTLAGRAILDDADAAAQRTTLGLGTLATQDTITESQISDLGSYITATSTDTLTNKSGNISQFTNDSGYLTTETNNLSNVSGTLAIANGGTGSSSAATARVALLPALATNGSKLIAVNSGATDIEYIATSTLSITESQISDLQTYLTAETNDLGTAVTGTLGTANGGTGLTSIGTAGQILKVNSGATALEFADESGGGGSGSSYIEHSSTVSDSLAISAGTNRMYIGNTSFSSGGVTIAGYLVISHGYANFTGASALDVTGTLNVVS